MAHETVRRWITAFLLALLAAVSLRGGEAKEVALTLTPIAALLLPVMRFYFTRPESRGLLRRLRRKVLDQRLQPRAGV